MTTSPLGCVYLVCFERVIGNPTNPKGAARTTSAGPTMSTPAWPSTEADGAPRILAACVGQGVAFDVRAGLARRRPQLRAPAQAPAQRLAALPPLPPRRYRLGPNSAATGLVAGGGRRSAMSPAPPYRTTVAGGLRVASGPLALAAANITTLVAAATAYGCATATGEW